jgi:hypothetical protein
MLGHPRTGPNQAEWLYATMKEWRQRDNEHDSANYIPQWERVTVYASIYRRCKVCAPAVVEPACDRWAHEAPAKPTTRPNRPKRTARNTSYSAFTDGAYF